MSKLTLLLSAALLAGCAVSDRPSAPQVAPGDGPALVLGVYDPRAIALAYYRSPAHAARVQTAVREHERAQAAGDAATAQRLEQEMEALQERAHAQTFGGAAAPEILAQIAAQLPEIAQRAGVDAIVALPDLAWLRAGADYQDVSLALADAFHPDEATRGMLRDLLRQEPVPLR